MHSHFLCKNKFNNNHNTKKKRKKRQHEQSKYYVGLDFIILFLRCVLKIIYVCMYVCSGDIDSILSHLVVRQCYFILFFLQQTTSNNIYLFYTHFFFFYLMMMIQTEISFRLFFLIYKQTILY